MMRTIAFMIFIVAILPAGVALTFGQSRRVAPSPTPREDDEAVKVLTEEIRLNVLAFDESGKFAPDVTVKDLVITENNVINQPTSVRRIPANVLIVMDTGGELRQVKSLEQTRKTARALVNALNPGDLVAIMQYSDRAEIISEWTDNRDETLRAINRADFGRRSVFVDALNQATDFLQKVDVGNKHLVLITDGTDSSADIAEKTRALERLRTTDISVHVLSYTQMEVADITPRTKTITNQPPPKAMPDEIAAQMPNGARDTATAPKWKTINLDRTMLRRLRARKADLENSEMLLTAVAENTNGEIIVPATLDEMVEKTKLVAKNIDAAYSVTYTPKIPYTEKDNARTIDVTAKRPGLVVQARRKVIVATDPRP